ncbi:MAG: DNA polymerase III subunit delta' [Acidobacteria bacterium]|nr:DNA polymerase III subunit delta' [Acidobacteriota bacterium]
MSWETLIGNDRVKATLKAALIENRLAHGLIFSGPDGVGKRQFALTVAKAVNCVEARADSCDHCAVCRKIEAGDHIDVQILGPDGAFIKVSQVRQLVGEANYRPFESRKRVFILDPASAMNEQAANALLKTLEEPPATSLVILITDKLQALLPTVRSRCQIHTFTPLKVEQVEDFLRARYPRPEAEIKLIARLSAGRIGRALEIDLSAYQEQRKETIELLKLLVASNNQARLIRAAEYLGRKLSREEFERRLDVLNIVLRDVFRFITEGGSAEVTNIDMVPILRQLAKKWSLEKIEHFTGQLETLRRNLQQNIHRQIALEEIFLLEMSKNI